MCFFFFHMLSKQPCVSCFNAAFFSIDDGCSPENRWILCSTGNRLHIIYLYYHWYSHRTVNPPILYGFAFFPCCFDLWFKNIPNWRLQSVRLHKRKKDSPRTYTTTMQRINSRKIIHGMALFSCCSIAPCAWMLHSHKMYNCIIIIIIVMAWIRIYAKHYSQRECGCYFFATCIALIPTTSIYMYIFHAWYLSILRKQPIFHYSFHAKLYIYIYIDKDRYAFPPSGIFI